MILWEIKAPSVICLLYCGRCQALCIRHFLKLSFCVSMETGAQAPARETEWDQCSEDHGSLPFC